MGNAQEVANGASADPQAACDMKWWQVVLVFAALILFLSFAAISFGAVVPNRLFKIIEITSGSMEPAIKAGDLICLTPVTAQTALKAGDIVTFVSEARLLVTHRIAQILPDGEIVTRGDANNVADSYDSGWKLKKDSVIGICAFRIPYLGLAIGKLQQMLNLRTSAAYFLDADFVTFRMVFTPTSLPPATPTSLAAAQSTPTSIDPLPQDPPVEESPTETPAGQTDGSDTGGENEQDIPLNPEQDGGKDGGQFPPSGDENPAPSDRGVSP